MLKIPADMKAKDMDEAKAMSLAAAQVRRNVEHGQDRGFEHKEASLSIADDLDDAANSYLILSEIPARGVGGEFVQMAGDNPPVICPPREQISRVCT